MSRVVRVYIGPEITQTAYGETVHFGNASRFEIDPSNNLSVLGTLSGTARDKIIGYFPAGSYSYAVMEET